MSPSAEGSADGTNAQLETACEPSNGEYPALEGHVFFPETYLECTHFRILGVSRRFRTSVGRGPTACHRDRREYVAYGISYTNVEGRSGEGVDGRPGAGVEVRADVGIDGPMSTFLAVETPDEGGPPLPHEYFVPNQQFQFVSTDGEFVFHTRCSESPTPTQRAVFSPVI